MTGRIRFEDQNLIWRYTFSLGNQLLLNGEEECLSADDLLELSIRDKSNFISSVLNKNLHFSLNFLCIPRLMVALWKSQFYPFTFVAVCVLLEGTVRVSIPVVLGMFLSSLQNGVSFDNAAIYYAILLSFLCFTSTTLHHILYFWSFRMGWNWRSATVAIVFSRIFHLKASIRSNSVLNTGNLINLVSNDVSTLEGFALVKYTTIFNNMSSLKVVNLFCEVCTSFLGSTIRSDSYHIYHIPEIECLCGVGGCWGHWSGDSYPVVRVWKVLACSRLHRHPDRCSCETCV